MLLVLGSAVVALALRSSPATVLAARVAGLVAGAGSAFGIYEHVASNYAMGSLDPAYGDRWASLSLVGRWWAAASGGVGPAPSLAPGVLAYAGLCLALATLHHPARRRSTTPSLTEEDPWATSRAPRGW